jgi:hypothetical protein
MKNDKMTRGVASPFVIRHFSICHFVPMPINLAPLAALTVMLWILWSDSVRPRKPTKFVYLVRVVLFLGVAAVMVWNVFRYPGAFQGASLVFTWVAVAVGVLGAIYFGRKVTERPAELGTKE